MLQLLVSRESVVRKTRGMGNVMIRQTHKYVLFLLTVIIGCAHADNHHLADVRFRIVDEATGAALANRDLNICRFVYFKLKPGAPSPYLSKDASWYITSVTTDENGIFSLDLSSIDAMDIVVAPGRDYNIVRFERSLDLAHTKSADHIRVVRFERGTTRVRSNMIYDLKRRMVKIIPISGQGTEQKPYDTILLVANKQDAYLNAIIADDLETVRELLTKDPKLVSLVDERGKGSSQLPALHLAVYHGHADVVELLLSKGANANRKTGSEMGPLHMAASRGHAELVKLLVTYGADVNGRKNDFRSPPLCYAANGEVAEALIANGAEVNFRDKRQATPLHSIAARARTEAAEVLLRYGADVNAKDTRGWTPLHKAADRDRMEMVAFLVAKGADINVKDNSRRTPLSRAIEPWWGGKGHREVAEFLLSKGAEYAIRDVVWLGDVGRVRQLLQDNPALANAGSYEEFVLATAIREGHAEIAEMLLANGARPYLKDRYEEPILHTAAYAGHKDLVELLIKNGLDVNQKGPHGEPALHWAVAKGHNDVVEILVAAGSDVNAKSAKQRVDMDTRVKDDADIIAFHLRYLADCERQRQATLAGSGLQIWGGTRLAFVAGDTPLHSAAQLGRTEIVKLLIAKGADVDATNRWGQTPLHYASLFYHKEIVEKLLEEGADVNAEDENGYNPLGLASVPRGVSRNEVAQVLLAHGAEANTED